MKEEETEYSRKLISNVALLESSSILPSELEGEWRMNEEREN